MNKVVIKILQGIVVTQNVLGGQNIMNISQVANLLQCMCAKNYESWLAVDNVIE